MNLMSIFLNINSLFTRNLFTLNRKAFTECTSPFHSPKASLELYKPARMSGMVTKAKQSTTRENETMTVKFPNVHCVTTGLNT